jgi:hypothetical protein
MPRQAPVLGSYHSEGYVPLLAFKKTAQPAFVSAETEQKRKREITRNSRRSGYYAQESCLTQFLTIAVAISIVGIVGLGVYNIPGIRNIFTTPEAVIGGGGFNGDGFSQGWCCEGTHYSDSTFGYVSTTTHFAYDKNCGAPSPPPSQPS